MKDEEIFETLNAQAKKDGAQLEILVERNDAFSVSHQKGELDKFNSSSSQVAGIRVIGPEGFAGYTYSEDLRLDAMLGAYRDALVNARSTAEGGDPESRVSLFDGSGGEPSEMMALYNDSLKNDGVESKLARARLLESEALSMDPRIQSVPYNGYNEIEGEVRLYTSTGVRRRQRHTTLVGYTYCLATDGEEKRMAANFQFTRDLAKFDPKEVARASASLALNKLGARAPKTGKYTVVFENEVVANLFSLIAGYFSAKTVFEKRSIFGNDLGKVIASPLLSVLDEPFYEGGTQTCSFDSEGAPSKKTSIISDGKLESFLTNSIFARRMKLAHTSNASRSAKSELGIGVSNMVIAPGKSSFESLLGAESKVIFINELKGFHAGFQAGTGDFSLPAEGDLYEGGKRVGPLCDFVVSGNIRELLNGIEAVSDRVMRPKSSVIAPDLLVRELSIAAGGN